MSYREKMERIRSEALQPQKEKAYYSNSGFLNRLPMQQDGITALFANLYGGRSDMGLSNPRESLDAYRQIFRNIPQFADVVSRKRDMIGNPIIEADDTKWADEMNAWLAQLSSIGEVENPYGYDKGISCLLDQLIETMYVDGSGFTTFLDNQGKDLVKGKLGGVRVHDSQRFHYEQSAAALDVYDLWYCRRGMDEVVTAKAKDYFKALQFDRTQWLWGKPLAYHSEFVLRLFLVSVGAREQANARMGAPLELTMFGFSLPTALDPAMYSMMTDDARNYANQAANAYKEAIANKNTKLNAGVDVVGVAPANMTISSHSYGKDAQSPPNFQLEAPMYLQWAASSWGYPLALIGMDSGGDGLGSQKYAYAAATANLAAATSQIYLSQNIIQPLIDRRMLDERTTAPKGYRIVWSGKTLEDQAKESEIKKMEAETAKTTIEAWASALMNLSPQEQQTFRERLKI